MFIRCVRQMVPVSAVQLYNCTENVNIFKPSVGDVPLLMFFRMKISENSLSQKNQDTSLILDKNLG